MEIGIVGLPNVGKSVIPVGARAPQAAGVIRFPS